MVKFRGVMERTSEPVPDELRRIRQEMGFDYGKFDYGVVNGEVVLYDVNRTPGASADPRVHAQTVEALSPGLLEILSRPTPPNACATRHRFGTRSRCGCGSRRSPSAGPRDRSR